MEFRRIILMSLQIMHVLARKSASSSDESIENLLYFKDCQKKNDEPTTHPPVERLHGSPKPTGMDCPFPKMCCSITCNGNDQCGSPTSPFMSQEMGAEHVFPPIKPLTGPMQPGQSPINRNRKKKMKQPLRLQMPSMLSSRRDFGFTKDRIKNLINQDDDIRKILKDLVRVTMQKVDLVEKINTRRQGVSPDPPRPTPRHNDHYDDDDEDLE